MFHLVRAEVGGLIHWRERLVNPPGAFLQIGVRDVADHCLGIGNVACAIVVEALQAAVQHADGDYLLVHRVGLDDQHIGLGAVGSGCHDLAAEHAHALGAVVIHDLVAQPGIIVFNAADLVPDHTVVIVEGDVGRVVKAFVALDVEVVTLLVEPVDVVPVINEKAVIDRIAIVRADQLGRFHILVARRLHLFDGDGAGFRQE